VSKWEWDSDGESGWELFRGEKGLCQVLQPQGAADLLNTLEAHLAELATHACATCATCAEWDGPNAANWGTCEYLSDRQATIGYEIPQVDTPGDFRCDHWHGKEVNE
jgi:hypothetical protein